MLTREISSSPACLQHEVKMMIAIGINAIQRARKFEIKTDENITVGVLAENIGKIICDDEPGYLLSRERKGFMAAGGSLCENGIRTGTELIYISKLTEEKDKI